MTIHIPVRIHSEANLHEHWRVKYCRRKKMMNVISLYLPKNYTVPPLPCTVVLRRIAPRELDYDNLVYSMKYIRDYVADIFTPNLAAGRADNIKGLEFLYEQKKGKPKIYALQIEFNPDL